MGEAKHTPGPWTVEKYDGSDKEIRITEPAVEVDCDDVDREVAAANAALIAAAPDLLEALTELLKHAGIADADPSDIDGEDHARESKARAAIAKATP